MTTIPDRIWEDARSLRNAVCWQSNSSVEPIAQALLAAEKRGREAAAKIADAHAECERDCGDVIAAAIRSTN
jgi:hypothetical protein